MKKGPWRDLLRFTTQQWLEGLQQILPHVDLFIDLISQFESRYESAKQRERALDFADLERQTLHILQQQDGKTLAPSPAGAATIGDLRTCWWMNTRTSTRCRMRS